MGESLGQVCLLGGAARSRAFVQLVADVTARSISHVDSIYPAARAFAWLAARAAGTDTPPPTFSGETVEPQLSDRYEEGYLRYAEAGDAVQRELTGWAA
jgi:sugar (pentulose or hexulose) kinase